MPPDDEKPAPFVSGPLPPDEIEHLLRVVDERVRLRGTIPDIGTVAGMPAVAPDAALDPATTFDGESLGSFAAPLFDAGKGGPLVRVVKNVLNVPLRVLGQPQAYFNAALRHVIASWADVVGATLDNLAALQREVAAQRARLADLEARLRRLERGDEDRRSS